MKTCITRAAALAVVAAALAGPASAVTTWSVTGVFSDETTVIGSFDYDGASATNIALQTFAGSGLSAASYAYSDTVFFGGQQAPFLNAPSTQATTDTRLLALFLTENLPASAPLGKGIAGVLGQSVEGFCDIVDGVCNAVDNITRPYRAMTGLAVISQGPAAAVAPIPAPAAAPLLAAGVLALFGLVRRRRAP